jgi:hypothetical protein
MGLSSEPKVSTVDTTPQFLRPLQQQATGFLQSIFQNPSRSPFAGLTSPLQQQAVGNLSTFLNMPAPEMRVLNQVERPLLGLLQGQAPQNPFGPISGFEQSQALVGAAQPIFQQNLQTALGQLSSSAPNRFSTTFQAQGQGLAQRALQDFNVFAQQAMQQGLGLDLQSRQQALDFLLGGQQLAQQGQLGAAQLLGQLAGQAGSAPFGRALAAGQLGQQITQGLVNPQLQLMLGGLQFGQPIPLTPIVQQGGGGLGGVLGSLAGLAVGSFLGPFGSAIGQQVGERIGRSIG